jgi:hypothetical protein
VSSKCVDVVILLALYVFPAIVDDERPRGKVTKFLSGDDLEDDFLTDDTYSANKDKPSESKVGSASDSKESHVKPKKKQGPKIVNFVA